VARSRELPVVVDFWAPWCAPCRQLGPLLEKVAAEHAGALRLVKVNVDEAPASAQAFGVRSVPAVVGLRDGQVVAEFVGAQPEPAVRRFVQSLLPSEADRLTREADELLAGGHAHAAEERYRAALAGDERHARALFGLARLLSERGEAQQALDLLERLSPVSAAFPEAERMAAALRMQEAAPDVDEAALLEHLAENEGDLAARLALGRARVARGAYDEGLAELLEVVERDKSFEDEAARKAMLDVFELLGSDHELVQRYRSALARALFR
jgi:putative thioredoxin